MYLIDYGEFHYNENFHGSALQFDKPRESLEFRIYRLLSYVDYICYLNAENKIKTSEFKLVRYEVLRVYESVNIRYYLWNIYHFSHTTSSAGVAFPYLIDFMIRNAKLLKFDRAEFENKDSKLYPKYLNF